MSRAHYDSSPGYSLRRAAAITVMTQTIVVVLDSLGVKPHTATDAPVKMMVRMELTRKPFNTRANGSMPVELRSQNEGCCRLRTK